MNVDSIGRLRPCRGPGWVLAAAVLLGILPGINQVEALQINKIPEDLSLIEIANKLHSKELSDEEIQRRLDSGQDVEQIQRDN